MLAHVAQVAPVAQSLLALVLSLVVGVWPLDPRPEVVHDFAPPPHEYAAGHRGVDLLGSPGQQVVAVQAGTVSYAGMLAGRGVVVVTHGDTRSTYEPVTASVDVSQPVRAGQRLGTLQAAGGHCPPRVCLHLGLLRGETYLDPLSLFGPAEVRLLPLLSVLTSRPTPWSAAPMPPRVTTPTPSGWLRPR